ncbi:MAG: LysR family transcriptional regulator [Gammaproteobacteria bacterium]|nr:LysR family transcriptional regulator [Gammaproteobacteria bacterium]
MNVTVKQLRIFVEVARHLSFAAAGNHLHLSQPAISLAIQNLEQHIGGKLFDRNTRHLALTPEGQSFYPTALGLLNQWSQALDDVHNLFTLQRGKLNMAVMPSFGSNGLEDVVAQYHKLYPEINLAIDNIVMDQAIEGVRKGRYEMAVMFAAQNMNAVEFTPLFTDHFMAIYSDEYAQLLNGVNLQENWQALFDCPMVVMDKDSSIRRWIEEEVQSQQLQIQTVAEVNQIETLGRFVAKGLGVGIVPSLCQQQMQGLGLHMQALGDQVQSREVGVVTSSQHSLSTAAQSMLKLLQNLYA